MTGFLETRCYCYLGNNGVRMTFHYVRVTIRKAVSVLINRVKFPKAGITRISGISVSGLPVSLY
jgi:hypothetical protein